MNKNLNVTNSAKIHSKNYGIINTEMKMSEIIARLMAAIETPDDLTQEDVNCLLEDAHIALQEVEDE